MSFLNERRREIVEEATSREEADDEKEAALSSPVNVSSTRLPHSRLELVASPSRSTSTIRSDSNVKDDSLATDTTDEDELSSAASSTPPSPTQFTASSSTHSPIDRELSFFPTRTCH